MPKRDSPKARSWDKLSQLRPDETNANRDVFESQQLDRSKIEGKRAKWPRTLVALIAGFAVAVLLWIFWSMAHWGINATGLLGGSPGYSEPEQVAYYREDIIVIDSTHHDCYLPIHSDGRPIWDAECYLTEEEAIANPPQWYVDYQEALAQREAGIQDEAGEAVIEEVDELVTIGDYMTHVNMWKLGFVLLGWLLTFGLLQPVLMRNLQAQNLMHDTSDINQYQGDQHIALPEEIQRKFSWFPDVGAHSSVQPSSMISHVMITNKGLEKVEVAQRAEKDVLDEDGEVEIFKGEILFTDEGAPKTKMVPMIDEEFGDELFDASDLPKDKKIRKKYDTTAIEYNPGGKDREKTGDYKTVADLINQDWSLPLYEPQRPAGAYIVDEAPVNTMVLAITRAGKGQTYIEPMIDMWLREKRPNNMVVNDPKGELLVKHYVRATMRGYQVVQFNLINAMKTDIYNPLGLAAEAAREGDNVKTAAYVNNIADVFFPLDGGEDPVWPNAANNAFKRAAYGLIDFYLEEERELRNYALRTNMDPKVLDNELDKRWGKVTLYNCYQLFVQLTAKKVKNPQKQLKERVEAKEFGDPAGDDFDDAAYEAARAEADARAFLWEDKPELDQLTLFFNATQALPSNFMRDLVGDADNALRSMGAAEKMLASVYGIAITAMSFFTDPTISTLTSGTPRQNTDLGGLSFPRRMGVRFHANFLKKNNLPGAQAKWDAWEDPMFTKKLDGDFDHEDTLDTNGWARYYFKGMFKENTAYLRLRLVNPRTGMLIRVFYFRFTKDYQTSLDGRRFTKDPITGAKIVKDGILVELVPHNAEGRALKMDEDLSNAVEFKQAHTTFKQVRLTNLTMAEPEKEMSDVVAIVSNQVRYSEATKAVFLVTPPHLMQYAKLILILIKQLVDLNFDKSYMTKSNQKPLYKTRFMLDELGNLQSEGSGISGFETMLSIGLGQEQQFTLILQTLQQLKAVYGDDTDKIVQGNVSNIIFLKSTDDEMIETLEKMSGKTHTAYMDSKTVTKDMSQILQFSNVEGKVSYTMSTKEEPVIKYNDMAFLSARNSIVFRAGDPPVWNRNETILPMSWRLFKNTIVHPGHEYSLQTIPTLSSALEFDVRQNQPDFEWMLSKRMKQAEAAQDCMETYQRVFGYSDTEISRLNPDVHADEVMELVDVTVREQIAASRDDVNSADDVTLEMNHDWVVEEFEEHDMEEAVEFKEEMAKHQRDLQRHTEKVYAAKQISRDMLVNINGGAVRFLEPTIIDAYRSAKRDMERDADHFSVNGNGDLCSRDGKTVYISAKDDSEFLQQMKVAAESKDKRVFSEDTKSMGELSESAKELSGFEVHDEFFEFLAKQDSWLGIARGEFDKEMARKFKAKNDETTIGANT